MRIHSRCLCLVVLSSLAIGVVHAAEPLWTPSRWIAEDTIKLCPKGPEEGEHCFPVWMVVLHGNVYVRLGSRAAERMRKNTSAPILAVEVAGQRFSRVRALDAPEEVEAVAKAMAEKYWSDIIVHLLPHPLTMQLTAADAR